MASKFIALFALVAVASAQHYNNDYYNSNYDNHHYAAPAVVKQIQPAYIKQVQPALIKKVAYEQEAPANYEFNYDVHDSHTGDIKQQHEVAKDGAISGEYSLIDADGYRRIVSYTADDHHGFVANVRREPVEGHKIVAQPTYAKVVAPVVQKYVAPTPVYSAPVYSAPVVQKYVAQAPVYSTYSAPSVQKYVAPAPVVEKYVAPVVKTVQPVAYKSVAPVKYSSAENSAHVAVNAPHFNYHY
ncbi:cuticle protein-like [Chironomus tepperi]|uniref:cuticle protein-like n=1 Tax=Chironomus tepperi TaxID=113505 RepID=UPI00391F719C